MAFPGEGVTGAPSDSLEGIYAPLTDDQLAKVAKMRAAVDGVVCPASYTDWLSHHPTLFLTRFLVARKWVLDDAITMYKDAAAWRIAEGFETKPLFPCAWSVRGYDMNELQAAQGCGARRTDEFVDVAVAQSAAAYAAGWHKWDKEGRPIFIERSGLTKVREMVDRYRAMTAPGEPMDPLVIEPHKQCNEVGAQLIKYQNRRLAKEGKFIAQVTVIMDCKGLTMGHFYGPALDLLKLNGTMDQKYFPEGMHRTYVANAPKIVKFGWAIVKLWIPAESQKKVVFLSPGEATTAALLEAVDADCLPEFLGGTCRCEGSCVPEIDEQPQAENVATTLQLSIRAMTSKTHDVAVEAGTEVSWQFATVANDISFSVSFVNADDGTTKELVPASRCTKSGSAESSTLTAPADGVMQLKFDNGFAWMHGKTVQLRVTTKAPTA